MALVNVLPLGTSTISQSGTDSVAFFGVGTLNITGTQQAPITVVLSQVGGVGLLDTVNITYADVTLSGVAGVSALVNYNLGAGSTLRVVSNVGISAGTTFNFTGVNSHLVIGNGVNLSLLGAINGFGPGNNIDVASGSVTYTYADNTGSNTGGTLTLRDGSGNSVQTVALNTGEFTAASFNVHPDGTGGTLIDFATNVSTITATPATADLTTGANVVLTLGTTAPVTISGGIPTLALSDGGTATYDPSASTSTSLVFRHVVQPGQNTADLTVTGVNLNGAAITDIIGGAVNLAGGATNPAGILQIDTTAPTIATVTTTPGNGSLSAGQIVSFNVTPSEAVTVVGGPPRLLLNNGAIAVYDAASSTPTLMVFKYIVQPGQNTADLAVTGTSLNGAVITDGAGNPISLSGAIGNPAGILQIDTIAPTVLGVTTQPGSGSFTTGQVVAFNVTTSEAVTVANGTPTLTLNDGGIATYDAASSNPTSLVFKYTVQPGDNAADLAVTAANLNGAAVTDIAGNAINLAAAVGNPSGILQVDTTAPTVSNVVTTPSSGVLAAGQVVTINVTPSEAVSVTGGTPTLTLSDGGTATFDAANSTPTLLVFKHIVQPGQSTADLTITGAALNGATIADPAGNALSLSGAIGNPPGILRIDTTMPSVNSVFSVTATPGTADLTVGGTVAFQVSLTGSATITGGTPMLVLSDGGTANYDPASSTPTSLVFRHTVQPGQNTADLTVTAVALNGAAATDTNGNPVDFSGAVVNPAGVLQVDTTVPTITAVATAPGNGSVAAGQVVAFNVSISEAVTVVGGTPSLTLNDGGIATYDAASSTPTLLVFRYTVQPGQNTADLAVTGAVLNGAIIADGAGNAVNLSSAAGNPAGVLQVDTIAPTVIAVATQPGNGTLAAGQTVTFNVSTSEAITVAGGTPTLTLDNGGIAVYDAASSTPALMVFRYTIQPGQNSADLTVTAANLNGATVADAAGNALNLSGAIGNPPGVLQIDTLPIVTSVIATPPNGDLRAGGTIALQVNTSGPVTVTGGIPALALNDGGLAIYDAASSTSTMLVFRNTVQAGQNTPDLAVTAALLRGALITDASGRTVSLAGAVGNPAGILEIDTIAPTCINFFMSGSIEPGAVFLMTFNYSEPTTISSGTPRFFLSNGGISTRSSILSTPTSSVFTYTVQPGDDTDNIAIVGFDPDGALISDGAGNLLDEASVGAAVAAAQGNFSDVTMANAPKTIDVYRFFDTKTGTHFYTQDPAERAVVLNTRPDLLPEGPNGVGLIAVDPASNDPNAVAVYRFFDLKQGTHFFTASTTERDAVIASRPDMVYEPSSTFYEHTQPQAGDTAVYRFFDTRFGTHFYTDDPKERASILQNRQDLVPEGIGFYEPARNPAT